MSFRVVLVVLLTLCLCGILTAANSMIGVAVANGNFLLDRSQVVGNANVFDGSVVETERAMSDLSLTSGLKMRLGVESRGQVFHDRLVLQQGAGQVSGSKYLVQARGLRVIPVGSDATVRVALGPKTLVEVAALTGSFHVETLAGIRVANMTPGAARSFTVQAGAATPTVLCGTALLVDGKLMLTDKTAGITLELTGTGLEQYVGKSISVKGNMAGNDALHVLSVKRDACGGGGAAAAAGDVDAAGGAGAGAGTAAVAGAGTGLSTAAIAGIAVGGATGLGLGLAAANGVFSGANASK
jgi:hypothetical protein